MGHFCPKFLYDQYVGMSTVDLPEYGGAFLLDNDDILTRDHMVARTEALLSQASIFQLGPDGKPTSVHSSSWRAGSVCSARTANVSDPVVMAWGRWSSSAWTSYLSQTSSDLLQAASAVWRASDFIPAHTPADSRVGLSTRSALEAASLPPFPSSFEVSHLRHLVNRASNAPASVQAAAPYPADYQAFLEENYPSPSLACS